MERLVQTSILKELNQGDMELLDNISFIFQETLKEYRTIFEGAEMVKFMLAPKRVRFILERATSFVSSQISI